MTERRETVRTLITVGNKRRGDTRRGAWVVLRRLVIPFPMLTENDRAEVLVKYREWLNREWRTAAE